MLPLLDESSLSRHDAVANSRMNRGRAAVGVNSYQRELGFDPIAWLAARLDERGEAAWLDLCCGRGRALVEATEWFMRRDSPVRPQLIGVDLIDAFDAVPPEADWLRLESAALHQWETTDRFDLITCVHGLHYVGDKLRLIEHAARWLRDDGRFVASLDLTNLRSEAGEAIARTITKRLRDGGFEYNRRRHLLSCAGARSVSLGFEFVGARVAGPNYTGQEAVDSIYRVHMNGSS